MSGNSFLENPWLNIRDLAAKVDLEDKNFLWCVFDVFWVALHWNVLCRWEYHTRIFSKIFRSPYVACYCLSTVQIFFSNLRNYHFYETVKSQAQFETAYNDYVEIVGQCLVAVGAVLVVTSFLRLGWTGTWHGDHFGILMSQKVTSFPFNVLEHPMYVGAKLNFIGASLKYRSVVGLVLTLWVFIVYAVTEVVEGSFTDMIYAKAAKKQRRSKSKHKNHAD